MLHPQSEALIAGWQFASTNVYRSVNDCFNRLTHLINSQIARSVPLGYPPLGVTLFTTLAPFMVHSGNGRISYYVLFI